LLLAATAPTLIARDRVAGARAIEASGQCTHILLDDGLQSPSLAKTRRIIVVDARRGVGNGRVIPAGPLRAALAAQASLIDAIVFNHGFIEGPSAEPPIAKALADLTDAPQCHGRLLVDGDVGWLRGARVVAFAGIGVPAHFFRMLRQLGADLVEARAFGDHQPYDAAMAGGLLMSARHHGALLVTTEKDVVRIGRSTVEGAELADLARIVRVTFQLEDPSDWNRLLAE
jgi:tetraacyldisaccharide 4'-kinase